MEKVFRVIRIVTVPPVFALALLVTVYGCLPGAIGSPGQQHVRRTVPAAAEQAACRRQNRPAHQDGSGDAEDRRHGPFHAAPPSRRVSARPCPGRSAAP